MRHLLCAVAIALAPVAALGFDGSGGQPAPAPTGRLSALIRVAASFDCRNVSCKYLSSCEEACFKLIECGQSIRDRDKDGIPCENLCSRPCRR
jgi:hypothetical protein